MKRTALALVIAMAATSVPTAWAAVDVAPDGTGLRVSEGGLPVATVPLGTPPARRGKPSARIVPVAGRRILEVRVPVSGSPAGREEVWIGELGGAGAQPIWTGLTGPRDADAESALSVTVGDEGVDQHQSAPRLVGCDRRPLRLFPQRWDFAQRRFRPRPPALPPASPVTIEARRGDPRMPAGKPAGGFHFIAASSLKGGPPDARALTAPVELSDGNSGTVWAPAESSSGHGEVLTARSGTPAAVVGLRLLVGDTRDDRAFRASGRPTRATIVLGPQPDQQVDVTFVEDADGGVARSRTPFWIALPTPVVTSCVSVVLREVTPGKPVSIADIDVLTDLDGPDGIARLVQEIQRGDACEARVPILVGLGAPAVLPVAAAIPQTTGPGRECLVEALSRLAAAAPDATNDPAVGAAFASALRGASRAEERVALQTLTRLAAPPVELLMALLADGSAADADRGRAARVLAALDREEAKRALLASVGEGSPGLRSELRAIAAGVPAPFAQAAREAVAAAAKGAPARRGDLLIVLGAAAAREPEHREAAAHAVALGLQDSSFEVQGRSVQALGRLGGDEGRILLTSVRQGSDNAVLRYLAARELAGLEGEGAVTALRAALDDADPRVRETAAMALARRRDHSAGARLIAAAKQESWPFVRRAEIMALSELCAPGTGDLLVRAYARDVDDVRRAALVGLVRCRDPRSRPVLLQVHGRAPESPALRGLAARLLGDLRDPAVARPMAETLTRLRRESQADLALEPVAADTVRALARLGGAEAVDAAVALLADERPALKRAALEALGELCDAQAGATAVKAALRHSDAGVATAAAAAERRCRRE